jgi:hypothetical protein
MTGREERSGNIITRFATGSQEKEFMTICASLSSQALRVGQVREWKEDIIT